MPTTNIPQSAIFPDSSIRSSKVPNLRREYFNQFATSDLCLKITHNSILTYSKKNEQLAKKKYGNTWKLNFSNNKTKANMSKKSKQAICNALRVWGRSVAFRNREFEHDRFKRKVVLNFITLTLASKQKHCDLEIKRQLLGNIVKWLRDKHDMKNYVWVAEAQANDNIHFHIVVDVFVDKDELRKKWNFYQSEMGYESINEFKFKDGQAPGTKIEKIREPEKIGYYLAKYLTKSEERRKIYGRLGGMSDSVRNMEDTEVSFNVMSRKIVWDAMFDYALDVVQCEFCTIFKFGKKSELIEKIPFLKESLFIIDRDNCEILGYETRSSHKANISHKTKDIEYQLFPFSQILDTFENREDFLI